MTFKRPQIAYVFHDICYSYSRGVPILINLQVMATNVQGLYAILTFCCLDMHYTVVNIYISPPFDIQNLT